MKYWPIILLLSACQSGAESDSVSDSEAPSSPTRFVVVRPPSSQSLLEAPARIQGLGPGRIELTLDHRARITQFFAASGDQLEKGAPVAELVAPEVSQAAVQRRGLARRLHTIRARIQELERLKQEGLARSQPLFELKEQELDLSTQLAERQVVLNAYRLEADDLEKLTKTGRFVLRSPVAGVLVHRSHALGKVIEPGGEAIAVVQTNGPARVEVSLLGAVSTASTAPIFVGQDGREILLQAEPVNQIHNPDTGRLTVWYAPQSELLLPDGLSGHFQLRWPAGVMEIPSRALRITNAQTEVALLRGNTITWTPVKRLMGSGTSAIVSGPIKSGDQIAANVGAIQK